MRHLETALDTLRRKHWLGIVKDGIYSSAFPDKPLKSRFFSISDAEAENWLSMYRSLVQDVLQGVDTVIGDYAFRLAAYEQAHGGNYARDNVSVFQNSHTGEYRFEFLGVESPASDVTMEHLGREILVRLGETPENATARMKEAIEVAPFEFPAGRPVQIYGSDAWNMYLTHEPRDGRDAFPRVRFALEPVNDPALAVHLDAVEREEFRGELARALSSPDTWEELQTAYQSRIVDVEYTSAETYTQQEVGDIVETSGWRRVREDEVEEIRKVYTLPDSTGREQLYYTHDAHQGALLVIRQVDSDINIEAYLALRDAAAAKERFIETVVEAVEQEINKRAGDIGGNDVVDFSPSSILEAAFYQLHQSLGDHASLYSKLWLLTVDTIFGTIVMPEVIVNELTDWAVAVAVESETVQIHPHEVLLHEVTTPDGTWSAQIGISPRVGPDIEITLSPTLRDTVIQM